MSRQKRLVPTRTVSTAALASAVVLVIVWLVESVGDTQIPAAVVVALTTIVTFLAGYFMPPSADDQVVAHEKQPRPGMGAAA